jgi:hypothetical protein
MEFTFTTQLNYLIHLADDEYVAHCLDMDLVGTGATSEEAVEQLNAAVRGIVFFALKTQVFDVLSLCKSAPERYWEMFEVAKKNGVETYPLDLGAELDPVTIEQCRHFTYRLAMAA